MPTRIDNSAYSGTRNIGKWTKPLRGGLNRFAVCSGSRFREQPGFQSNPSLLPPERRCEEEGMLSAKQTHLAKELSNDTASTTHDRGHAGEELLTAYPKLLRAT